MNVNGMSFTQLPNFLWDRKDLTPFERMIMVHIIRKTVGWGKISDGISLSQFADDLGTSKPTVIKSIKSLSNKKIINVKSQKSNNDGQSFNVYSIHENVVKQVNDVDRGSKGDLQGVVKEIDRGSKGDLQGVVKEIDRGSKGDLHTIETNTIETNTIKKNYKDIHHQKKPSSNSVSKKTATKKTVKTPIQILNSFGVTDDLADDFIIHRRTKKAAITLTAMNGFQRESEKAGITISEALAIAIEKNWTGFNASWDYGQKKSRSELDGHDSGLMHSRNSEHRNNYATKQQNDEIDWYCDF